MAPLPDEAAVARTYDAVAESYDGHVEDLPHHEIVAGLLLAALGDSPQRLLDLACATGISSDRFFELGWSVTGVDVSPGMIREAGKRPFDRLVCQNLELPLELGPERFDAAILASAMELIGDPHAVFRNVHAALRPGGAFAVTVPMNEVPTAGKLEVRAYSPGEVTELVADTGFVVRDETSFVAWEYEGKPANYTAFLLSRE